MVSILLHAIGRPEPEDRFILQPSTHFFAIFSIVSSGSIFAILIFVGQNTNFKLSFFVSSLSTFVPMSLMSPGNSFYAVGIRQ